MTPTWWTNLEKRLKRIERSANLLDTVKKLHANKIFVPNLLEQLFEAEPLRDRPSTPAQSPQEHYDKAELEAAYGDPVIAASIFLFNKALDRTYLPSAIRAEIAQSNRTPMQKRLRTKTKSMR